MYFTSYHNLYEYIIKNPKKEKKSPKENGSPTKCGEIKKLLNLSYNFFLKNWIVYETHSCITGDFLKNLRVEILSNMLSMWSWSLLSCEGDLSFPQLEGSGSTAGLCENQRPQEGLAGNWECCAGAGTEERGVPGPVRWWWRQKLQECARFRVYPK